MNNLREHLSKRILLLDGSMGVLLHSKKLTEADYRGKRFADHPSDVKNNPDLLNLTTPEMGGHLSSRRPPSRPRRLYPG